MLPRALLPHGELDRRRVDAAPCILQGHQRKQHRRTARMHIVRRRGHGHGRGTRGLPSAARGRPLPWDGVRRCRAGAEGRRVRGRRSEPCRDASPARDVSPAGATTTMRAGATSASVSSGRVEAASAKGRGRSPPRREGRLCRRLLGRSNQSASGWSDDDDGHDSIPVLRFLL
jgi:hypothetical protein